jgi:hypothetical protein
MLEIARLILDWQTQSCGHGNPESTVQKSHNSLKDSAYGACMDAYQSYQQLCPQETGTTFRLLQFALDNQHKFMF